MTKLQFTLEVDRILNDNDCRILGIDYYDEGICKVSYSDDGILPKHFYVAYRLMTPASLKKKMMLELDEFNIINFNEGEIY